MITLFSGIPGSGKSYKMVLELSRVKDKFYVVHNIDGLLENYLGDFGMNFITYCEEKHLEVMDFFDRDYQAKLAEDVRAKYDRRILVIIDEAHEWFSSNSKKLRLWLSYHRHLDQEIWLVAHRSSNLPSVYRSFIEVEYRAKSGSILGLPGFFTYNRIMGGQRAGYKIERKKQAIFNLYRSQVIETDHKRKIPMMIPIMAGMVLIGLLIFLLAPKFMFNKKIVVKPAVINQTAKNQISAQPGGNMISGGSVAQAAMIPQIPKVPKEVDLTDKYAFIGLFDGKAIVEDRSSGEQISLSRVPGRMMLIEAQGLDFCQVLSAESGKQFFFYNSRRFQGPGSSGRSMRPEDPGPDVRVVSPIFGR